MDASLSIMWQVFFLFASYFLILILVGKLWVPATVINIAFVPPILRVLYLNVVFFFWSIFLSLKLNKDGTEIKES